MKTIVHVIAASFLLASAAHAENAARRPAGAICVDAESARLATSRGVALVSRGGSFTQARDGAELFAGDRLLIRGGAASLVAGGEVLARAGSGSLLTLDRQDGKLCVAQASSSPAAIAAAPSGRASNEDENRDCPLTDKCWMVFGGLAAAGVAGGVAAATSGGSSNDKTTTLIFLNNISPQ